MAPSVAASVSKARARTSASSSRLGPCETCEKEAGKYTCPGCQIVSCSLPCIRKHKEKNDCDGIRSRTEFVKFGEFSNMQLLNDYRLLEEIAARVDECERDKLNASHLESVSARMNKLKMAVLERGARLILLPLEFEQRKSNSSYYDSRSKTVIWRIKLNFLNAKKLTINQDSCSENMVLRDLVQKYLKEATRFPESVLQRLLPYRIAGIDAITVLMKTEKAPLSDKKFYKLDMNQTIKVNLVGKIIVEYPQFFILINGFFRSEKTKLDLGGKEYKEMNEPKNLLELQPEKKHISKPKVKRPKVDFLSDSSSDTDDDWDDTEEFFTPWYRRLPQ